ncbi:MAG: acetyl-CoA carboxylase biotin carboxyl carrier protein [Candidatus Limnocylindrales bacterium]
MTHAELVDVSGLVEPVAVGPGDPAAARPVDGGAARPVDGGAARPVDGAAGSVDGAAPAPSGGTASAPDRGDASLLALVDRLTAVLERGDLGELEVVTGGTTIILRAPSAIERPAATAAAAVAEAPVAAPAGGAQAPAGGAQAPVPTAGPSPAPAARPSVKAPLTGIFYGAPSPGATAYVSPGDHVSVGQIIGLIEAMKLFNEIKSDLAGRVVRICTDNGALVKARQPLIEVEPA